MAAHGEKPWPPVGRCSGRLWGEFHGRRQAAPALSGSRNRDDQDREIETTRAGVLITRRQPRLNLVRLETRWQSRQPPPRDGRHRTGQQPLDLADDTQMHQRRPRSRCSLLCRPARLRRTTPDDEGRHAPNTQPIQIKAPPSDERRPTRQGRTASTYPRLVITRDPLEQQITATPPQPHFERPVRARARPGSETTPRPRSYASNGCSALTVKWFENPAARRETTSAATVTASNAAAPCPRPSPGAVDGARARASSSAVSARASRTIDVPEPRRFLPIDPSPRRLVATPRSPPLPLPRCKSAHSQTFLHLSLLNACSVAQHQVVLASSLALTGRPVRKNPLYRLIRAARERAVLDRSFGRVRILWVSHSRFLGGAELALVEGADALRSRGHDVHVVVPEAGPLLDRLTGEVPVYECNHLLWATFEPTWVSRAKLVTYNAFLSGPRIARIARRVQADVVISNTVTTMAGALAASLARLPHVWFVHEFGREPLMFGDDLTFHLMRNSMSLCLVNSHALKARFREPFHGLDVSVIPQAVDVPEATNGPEPGTQLRLILVGAKSPFKGQHEALQALARLARLGLDVHLDLVGPEEHGHEHVLKELAQQLSVTECVTFIPFHPNPSELIHKADVVLVCSRIEAFGRTTVEGMKAGKPVVGAASGATPELIRHGWNGYLYRPGEVDDLTKWIQACYYDRPAMREMGRHGQRWAREMFNRERYGALLDAALCNAVTGRREPGAAALLPASGPSASAVSADLEV